METDVADLPQALARYAEFDPVFVNPQAIRRHNGVSYSIEALLEAWDEVEAVAEACPRPIAAMWRNFLAARASLADVVRPLLIHPREWLDTHPATKERCTEYLAVTTELYKAVQQNYRAVWDQSREWAQATLDAILSLDLVQDQLSVRPQHIIAIFDESTISVRRRRVERLLPMSPFCVRNEIVVDRMLGDISLSPHPGEPPFSDFVMMIHEFEQEQRDSTMIASADADRLRSMIDSLVLGARPSAQWVLLADRALPPESGMKAIRLLQRKEGNRQVLLSAANYSRLSTLMYAAFGNCNLTITDEGLGHVLRQGVNLVGAGLLDMIKKQSGLPDNAKILGFVGMLPAARDVRRQYPDALVASVDGRIARLWLKLGPTTGGERCDLIAVRRDGDG